MQKVFGLSGNKKIKGYEHEESGKEDRRAVSCRSRLCPVGQLGQGASRVEGGGSGALLLLRQRWGEQGCAGGG